MAMHSIYIGQLVRSAAAPLTMRLRVRLGDVAIVYYYPHPALRIVSSKKRSKGTTQLGPSRIADRLTLDVASSGCINRQQPILKNHKHRENI